MNFYNFHLGDYAVATRHLSLMEDLAYRRLLDLYYSREAALPPDVGHCARLAGMREEQDAISAILNEFFTLGPDGWTNFRCDAEIMKTQEIQAKASAAGRASGLARAKAATLQMNGRSTHVKRPLNRR